MKHLFFQSIWYNIKTTYYKFKYRKLKPLATMNRPELHRYRARVAKGLLFSMPDRHRMTRAQSRGIAITKAKMIVKEQTRVAKRLWGAV